MASVLGLSATTDLPYVKNLYFLILPLDFEKMRRFPIASLLKMGHLPVTLMVVPYRKGTRSLLIHKLKLRDKRAISLDSDESWQRLS